MIFWAFVAVLGLCILGEIMSNRFDRFYEVLCNRNWYLFSIEMQRMLVIFMPFAQESVTIRGGRTTTCRLETFKKVKYFGIQFHQSIEIFLNKTILLFLRPMKRDSLIM